MPANTSRLPPDADLPRDYHHVTYEIEMMWGAARLLRHSHPPTTEHNAFLESFVIHARNLVEFFSIKRKYDSDDMRATDFLPGFPALSNPPETSRMHKEIVHLTYARKKPGERRGWDVGKTALPLIDVSLDFLKRAAADDSLMAFGRNKEKTVLLIQLLSGPVIIDLSKQPYLSSSSAITSESVSLYSYKGPVVPIIDSAKLSDLGFTDPSGL